MNKDNNKYNNTDNNKSNLKIGETTSYQLYNFGYTKEYPTHDKYQQDRWKRAYEYESQYDEGVYKEIDDTNDIDRILY